MNSGPLTGFRTATLLWGVSVVAVVSLNGIGTFLAIGGDYEPFLALVVILNVFGCVNAALSFAIPRIAGSRAPRITLLTRFVVRLAFAESAGLLAFVATYITGLPGGSVALIASLAALAASYPSLAEWQRNDDGAVDPVPASPIVGG